jgi:hypothetical protein
MSSYKGYYGLRPANAAVAAAAIPLKYNFQYLPANAKNLAFQTVNPTTLAHPHNFYVQNAAALAQYSALGHGYPYHPYSSIAPVSHVPTDYAHVAAASYGLPPLAAKHYGYFDYPYNNGIPSLAAKHYGHLDYPYNNSLYHPFGYQSFGLPVVKASNDNNNSNASQENNNQESD